MGDTALPSDLQKPVFRTGDITLPSGLQKLTFGRLFNQSLDKTTLPSGLRRLTFGMGFEQSLDGPTLPSELMICPLDDDDDDENRLSATRPGFEQQEFARTHVNGLPHIA